MPLAGAFKALWFQGKQPRDVRRRAGALFYATEKNQMASTMSRTATADQTRRQPTLLVAINAVTTIEPATNIVTGQ